MKQRDEEIAKQVEILRHKLEEVEQLARSRGFGGIFNIGKAHTIENDRAKHS